MRIAQINPGLLQIPPKNWGAVEKIIWETKLAMEKNGHTVDIRYINEILPGDYDIVHVHMWNHAEEMHRKEIPYVFTFHDHHAFIYGKSSANYRNNLIAMENSHLSIVPAKYLVEYFNDIPVYLNHGVNLDKYTIGETKNDDISLLCVGNNGFGGDPSFDRKGFGYAIQAARKLQYPITVVGPTDCNEEFFRLHHELQYDKLTLKFDLTDEELIREYNSHTMLIHATSIEAGHPPLTLLEAAACGLPMVTTDCAGDLFTTLAERDVDSIVTAIQEVISLNTLYIFKTLESVKQFDWQMVTTKLLDLYNGVGVANMKNLAIRMYSKLIKRNNENIININFVDGPFFEMVGPNPKKVNVAFIDKATNQTIYNVDISNNQWAKCSRKWFTDWRIQLTSETGQSTTYDFDPVGKKILISLDSKSLGDTIAWVPYIHEFAVKNKCNVVASTFWNDLFKDEYPSIEFVPPGTTVNDLYASYHIGLYYENNSYDVNMHKTPFLKLSLQEIACDILGIEYKEVKPKIKKVSITKDNTYKEPYICIATHSTAQAKYWNNRTGWQELVDYVKKLGFNVYHLSSEEDGYMGNKNPTGVISVRNKTIEEIGTILSGSKLFVGLGSGLSWYSWALDVPTVLISGFSEPWQEMQTGGIIRIHNDNVCNGCFAKHYFNKGNWNWCPEHEGTHRQFECTKEITFSMVQPHIDKILIGAI